MYHFVLLILIVSCTKTHCTNTSPTWITIFIHGTYGLRPHLVYGSFFKIMTDNIEKTSYKKTIELLRENTYSRQQQPIQKIGLQPIIYTLDTQHAAVQTFATIFDTVTQHIEPESKNYYYTFGWSGLISPRARLHDAYKLYQELVILIKSLQAESPKTSFKIRIVGYSHGGTIALNLASAAQETLEALTINELVLIGTPVQKDTARHIAHPVFEKVYHLYSRNDKIQCLDCFSYRRFFSRRRFKQRAKKLTQIEIKIKKGRSDRSPGHMELWFFGWNQKNYRTHFPLYPVPVAAYVPAIITLANTALPQERNIIIEISPAKSCAHVRKRHDCKKITTNFLTPELIETTKNIALQNAPIKEGP